MKKKIYAAAVMLFAFAAPFVFTACDDDDDDTEESSSSSSSNSSSSNSTDDNSSSGSTSTTAGTAVDLGLSVKWASKNVGAAGPADYGNYYSWGETETSDEYSDYYTSTWTVSDIGDISGNTTYDAATANWGSKWRMPTYVEIEELIDDCTWTYTTQENSKGVDTNGYLVTGSNGNSIFLPEAGEYVDTNLVEGYGGFYWSSSSDYYYYYSEAGDNNLEHFGKNACLLVILSSKYYLTTGFYRYFGLSVRPVSD